jgi:hypothetical protein
LSLQRERHVASPAAQVEDACVGPSQNVAKGAGSSTPPNAVDIERQHVVEQIVAGRDGGKHFAHSSRRRSRIAGAFRRSADYDRGFANLAHRYLRFVFCFLVFCFSVFFAAPFNPATILSIWRT